MSSQSSSKLTPFIKLRVACIIGDGETVEQLLDQDKNIVNERLEYGKTPLCIAAGWGQLDICKYALF